MKMIISGKNIDVTPGLRSAVEAKLGKLERYFTADTEIYVTLSVEKDRQKIEVTIPMKGNIIRSEQTSSRALRPRAGLTKPRHRSQTGSRCGHRGTCR